MRVVAIYDIKGAKEIMEEEYYAELKEIYDVIADIDSRSLRIKISKEKTKFGKTLYSPKAINEAFRKRFTDLEWKPVRIECEYTEAFYINGYEPPPLKPAFREMDFVKNRVGVEVQFGKYAFMVYNVCAKMTIFHNLNHIDIGIEIVPVKELQLQMSTGVSYFEQFVWDLESRGEADIDIPVLILGVAP